MSSLVTIATYEEQKTACILKEILENENIECHIAYIHNPGRNADDITFQVKADDVKQAVRVMLNISEKFGKPIEELEPQTRPFKILVPTDFSPGSENACHYAIHLARKLKGEIKVFHVYENPIMDVGLKESATFETYAVQLRMEMDRMAREGILRFTRRMKEYMEKEEIHEVKIHSTIAMGNILQNIRRISELYQPNLLVLGTRGAEEAPKSILAGVAEEIIKRLNIPVYAIPGTFSAENFENVKILYATDFNESDHSSLEKLLKIISPFNVSITCIHIDTPGNPTDDGKIDQLNDMLIRDFSKYKIQCCLIEDADVYHGIKDFAESNQINLLSMTTQKRGIFEFLFKPNLFKKILQESNLPMLIFHA